MKINTTKDRPQADLAAAAQADLGDGGTAAAPRVPQRLAHLRAGHRRHERHDDRLRGEHRAGAQGAVGRAAATPEGAQVLGKTIAERLMAKGIKRVVFDRGGYLYHGRIRAVAEAAREAGLEF